MHAFYPSIVSHRTGSEEARKIRLYKNLIKYHHEKWKSKGKKKKVFTISQNILKKLFLEQQKKFLLVSSLSTVCIFCAIASIRNSRVILIAYVIVQRSKIILYVLNFRLYGYINN